MRPNKERFNSLADLTVTQLRGNWGKADDTPGEQVYIPGLGSVTKGEVYLALVKSSMRTSTRSRRTFHPIDGSWGMRRAKERGRIMAGSRR